MDQDLDSMNVDTTQDPNELYKPIIAMLTSNGLISALKNDQFLNWVLWRLARTVPDRTFDIDSPDTVAALRKNDLRALLSLGHYDEVAREVLRRCITEQQKPTPLLGGCGAVRDAFETPYIGDSGTVQKAVEQVVGDTNLYANAIPFVQSSGTGKSRLMVELAQDFFVLMLNLREDDPRGSFSYPQPDCAVRTYLQVMNCASRNIITSKEYWRLRYAAFLCAIFDVLSAIVAEGAFTPPQFARTYPQQLVGWRVWLETIPGYILTYSDNVLIVWTRIVGDADGADGYYRTLE